LSTTELVKSASLADLQRVHAARFRGYSQSDSNVCVHPTIRCQLGGCGCAWNTFVWVSQPLRCIWFEIPKNASSSFKEAAELAQGNPHQFQMHDGSPDSAMIAFPGFRRFTILRDPVHRIRSVYRMFCRSELTFRHRQLQTLFGISDVRLSFHDFLTMAARTRNHHWEQMVRFLPTTGTAGVIPFRMGAGHVFAADFEASFAAEFGISLELPRVNTTNASDDVGLIRSRGHLPRGGYDVQNGFRHGHQAHAATVH
jgi:hypothetical protein